MFDRPAHSPIIVDGGLSTYLESEGYDVSTALWSASLLAQAPSAIEQAHRDFFSAGAEVAVTASYQASFAGFAAAGMTRPFAEEMMRRSVRVADHARAAFRSEHQDDDRPLWIAASIGPYGARLTGGAEYAGRYGLSVERLRARHRAEFEVLASADPDVLACETIPDIDEAEALIGLIEESDKPAWLSYTIRDGRTAAGQPLEDAFAAARDVDGVVAVGVNCCDPVGLTDVIALAGECSGKPVIVYPNSGESWDATARRWTGRPRYDPRFAPAWRDAGARLIGGCCRVHPPQITAVAAALTA
ncbi:homocysteine S-methyltransferase [Spelaeicoccus albus]|uniref:Homocysteine S-methyltransferase n=1 Tax=Spelaeicoccus albus TaxID=1280376 RepID=A0A7Z0D2N4_9MICO|nr:homocysteine S-methyltransferase [Spelaeicoccus albus]NYI67703.1 homocysteine S-methyltransferase [Spelaeicoccus albus]